jgi:hypothetical protein
MSWLSCGTFADHNLSADEFVWAGADVGRNGCVGAKLIAEDKADGLDPFFPGLHNTLIHQLQMKRERNEKVNMGMSRMKCTSIPNGCRQR